MITQINRKRGIEGKELHKYETEIINHKDHSRETVEIPTLSQLILMVIFTEDVETESETGISLMYGRIGKHPMQSLYTGYYHTL